MTVQTTNTASSTTADGIEVTFNFTFQSLDATWVKAQTLDPGEEDPTQRTDITVNLNADQEATPGGSVTFDTAPIVGATVTIYRQTPKTQQTDYTDYDAFPAESHEDALDKLTFIAQEIQDPGGVGGDCSAFLPLAGGVMEQGANIDWQNPAGLIASSTFDNLLTQPSFLWAPKIFTDEIGYSWGATDGKILGYNTDGRFSATLEGRALTLSQLIDQDLITKRDLDEAGLGADPVFNSVGWDHQTNVPSFGKITAGYKATSLALTGGQGLVFEPSQVNIYQGYKFITETSTGDLFEIDIAGGGIWLERTQTDGGASDPLPNEVIQKQYADQVYAPISSAAAGWQLPIAAGGIDTAGAAVGTLRNCTVAKLGTGQYQINLFQNLSGINEAELSIQPFGAIFGLDWAFSAVALNQIQVNFVLSGTSTANDANFTFSVRDRGLN